MNDVIRIDPDRSEPAVRGLPVLPEAKVGVAIRPGVVGDVGWIDAMQKPEKKALGFMYEGVIRGHLEKGHVLVAEATGRLEACGLRGEEAGRPEACGLGLEEDADLNHSKPQASGLKPCPVGYLIGTDRYLKRDELGIIYQLNVRPAYRRSLVAANLLRAQFERSAYGCRLYCCWCAQDLKANAFWEAMGFVPLAFRTGGGRRKKDGPRMHIFWQKRIRTGDHGPGGDSSNSGGGTPYWFPSLTGGGAIGEDRIVLPIPPGTGWRDAKPVVLPGASREDEESRLLEAEVGRLEKELKGLRREACGLGVEAKEAGRARPRVRSVSAGGLYFGPRPAEAGNAANAAEQAEQAAKAKQAEAARLEAELKAAKRAAARARKKFDPGQVAFARELKDRWLEEVVARPGLLAPGRARYDVSRAVAPGSLAGGVEEGRDRLQLPGGEARADAA